MFVNRILEVLRSAPIKGQIKLPPGFFNDFARFNIFLDKFNGIVKVLIKDSVHHQVYVDSSLM